MTHRELTASPGAHPATASDRHRHRYLELLAEAVQTLTEAGRLPRSASENGSTLGEQVDLAEFVTLTVAGAAANLGGIEQFLDGRPGSWEASIVRDMLTSTVGDDERYLAEHRTEPITVKVNVDDLLNDLGVWAHYDAAYSKLDALEDGMPVGDIDELSDERQAQLTHVDDLRRQLDTRREREWATYGEEFAANVRLAASQLMPGLKVPVTVTVEQNWQGNLGSGDSRGSDRRLWEWARGETSLPGTSIPLKDYPIDARFIDVERRAGRDLLTVARSG